MQRALGIHSIAGFVLSSVGFSERQTVLRQLCAENLIEDRDSGLGGLSSLHSLQNSILCFELAVPLK